MSPIVMTLTVAGALALSGCTASASSTAATGTYAAPTTTATSAAQVSSLGDAVAYALTVTPTTPLDEVDQAGRALKKYTDASSKLTTEDKSEADGFIAQSQQAISAKDEASAGADLLAAAQGVAQVLSGN